MIGWIFLGVLGLVLLIPVFGYFNLFGFHLGYSQEEKPELKCLIFSDGRQAVVAVIEFSGNLASNMFCIGHGDTLKWLSQHGYNITWATEYEVYLRR